MTETNDAPIVATLKAGGGYDAPWLVIRGSNPDEVTAMLRNLGDLPGAVVEASALLQAANNAAPIANVGPAVAAAPAPQAAPQQQAWGAPAQQQAPQQQQFQQQGGGRFAGTPHPEGKPCGMCGQVLVEKTTGGGKKAWRCPEWRWNNGNPNGHSSEWAN